jgi:hypothetical protein
LDPAIRIRPINPITGRFAPVAMDQAARLN